MTKKPIKISISTILFIVGIIIFITLPFYITYNEFKKPIIDSVQYKQIDSLKNIIKSKSANN